MPMARGLARRYRHFEEIEDLEQIAAIGLLKAIDRFDPHRGLVFSAFAFPTVLGELKRYLRDRGWSVRPPRAIQELAARVEHATNSLLAELGRSPTVPEIAARVGCTVEQVLEGTQAATARHSLSLDRPRREAEDFGDPGITVAIDETGFGAAEDAMLLDAPDALPHVARTAIAAPSIPAGPHPGADRGDRRRQPDARLADHPQGDRETDRHQHRRPGRQRPARRGATTGPARTVTTPATASVPTGPMRRRPWAGGQDPRGRRPPPEAPRGRSGPAAVGSSRCRGPRRG